MLWAGLAVALWIVSLEEISWGQRLFELPTPALLEANVQDEMNVHNLPFVQRCLHVSYIAVGLFGSFAWALFGRRGTARVRELVRWLVPRGWLLACFLPVALFYAVFDFTPPAWVGSDGLRFGFISTFDQEPAELLLSLGFLFFAAHAFANLRFGSEHATRAVNAAECSHALRPARGRCPGSLALGARVPPAGQRPAGAAGREPARRSRSLGPDLDGRRALRRRPSAPHGRFLVHGRRRELGRSRVAERGGLLRAAARGR